MEVLAGFLGLAALPAIWILLARYGHTHGWSGFKRHAIGMISGILAMFVVMGVLAPFPPRSTSFPEKADSLSRTEPTNVSQPQEEPAKSDKENRLEKIRDIDGVIEASEPDGEYLVVTQEEKSIWDEKSWANSISLWTPEFIEKIAKEYPNQYSRVSIRYVVPTKDRYGNTSQSEAMTLTYDMSEIAKVNWEGASPFDILNFAEAYFRPLSRPGFTAWCMSGNDKYASDFCLQVIR